MRQEGREWAVAQWRWRSCKQDHVAQGAKVLTPRDEISKPGTWTRDSPPMSTYALRLALVKSGQRMKLSGAVGAVDVSALRNHE